MLKVTNHGSRKAPTVYIKQYRKFCGVDFSCSEAMVDDTRSPYAKNLISDTGGFPEKRVGWRVLNKFSDKINGIYRFDGENASGEKVSCLIVHAGASIYRVDTDESEPVLLMEGVADNKSFAKHFKGMLCILTGSEYLVFDGDVCCRAGEHERIYAPSTIVTRGAMGVGNSYAGGEFVAFAENIGYTNFINYGIWEDSSGNAVNPGVVPEAGSINLLTPRRKNSFCADTSDSSHHGLFMFILDGVADADSRLVMRCKTTGEVLFDILLGEDGTKSISMNAQQSGINEGANLDLLLPFAYSGNSSSKGNAVRVLRSSSTYVICRPKIYALSDYSYTEGVDNFEIEYSCTADGYSDRINKCTFLDVYENRVFFSGNPDFPNTDFASAVNDPTYVPDINYTEIGTDSTAIVGYLRTGDSQAILKEDGEDATVYMRTMSFDTDGKAIFQIKQGTSGLGAISRNAVCTFLDDPVYLSRNGVYAVAMQDISSERSLNIRSTRINKKLLKNTALSDAVMVPWNGYLVLCVGEECYVADAAQKSYANNKTGTFEYEWYYWTNIPARTFCEISGELYFGTDDGRLCKFNSDMKNDRGDIVSEAYADAGEAIVAEWSTNLSDDGDFMRKKTMVKKGSGVFLKTYNRSAVKVYVRTDAEFEKMVVERSAGIFNFYDIDFDDFTFNTSPYSVVPLNTKVKKYSAIQIICRNDKVNHAFGVHSIIRRFFIGNLKK